MTRIDLRRKRYEKRDQERGINKGMERPEKERALKNYRKEENRREEETRERMGGERKGCCRRMERKKQ